MYTVETMIQIWDDNSGDRIEIGPDIDGLDMIEVRKIVDGSNIESITLTQEQALLVADAIVRVQKDNWKTTEIDDYMIDGDECPNCHCGTIDETDDEFRCKGECGSIFRKEKR